MDIGPHAGVTLELPLSRSQEKQLFRIQDSSPASNME